MGTKSEWRNDKLRFYKDSMFVSAGKVSANVTATGTACKDETVLVSDPLYAGTLTTENNQHFRAVCGGVISSSSSICTFTLRHGTNDILPLAIGDFKNKSTKVPYQVEFNGRFANVDSSGKIAATGWAHAEFVNASSVAASMSVVRNTTHGGTTGAGTAYASSGHALATDSTLGLNITMQFGTTGKTMISNSYGYIHYFS